MCFLPKSCSIQMCTRPLACYLRNTIRIVSNLSPIDLCAAGRTRSWLAFVREMMNAKLQQLKARRMKAARLLNEGNGIRETARLITACPSSVWEWKQKLDQQGIQALLRIRDPSPGSMFFSASGWCNSCCAGARAAAFDIDRWTCARVAELIQETFGVGYHVDSVWRLLHWLGWSCQKPQQWARAAMARRR